MNEAAIAGILSLAGTIIGTMGGILTGTKMLEYRITQLESRMDEVRELVKRIYQLEQKSAVYEERLRASAITRRGAAGIGPT